MKSIASLPLIWILLSVLLSSWRSFASPGVPIRIDHGDQRVDFMVGEKSYELSLPESTQKIEGLGDRVLILGEIRDHLKIVTTRDVLFELERPKENQKKGSGLLGVRYGKLSLQSVFDGAPVTDFSSVDREGFTTLYFTKKGPSRQGQNSVHLARITFAKGPGDIQALSQEEGQTSNTPPDAPGDQEFWPVAGLTEKTVSLLGTGEIAVIADPALGAPLLLSLDKHHKLIHEYNIRPQGQVHFQGSYLLDTEEEIVSLSRSEKRADHFFLQTKKGRYHYSLLKMRIGRALQRTAIKNAVDNEVEGNTWVKNLLFWGLLSRGIDKLDEAVGNPEIDAEEFLKDEEIDLFHVKMDFDDFFEKLQNTHLFSESELHKMKSDQFLKSSRGKRWFLLSGFLLSYLGVSKLRKKIHFLDESLTWVTERIKTLLVFCAKVAGFNAKKQGNISKIVDRAQRRYKGRVLRRYENSQYPIKTIKKVESDLEKLAKALPEGQAGKNETLEFLSRNKKNKSLKARTNALIDFSDSKSVQDLIASYKKKLAQDPKRIRFGTRFLKGLGPSSQKRIVKESASQRLLTFWKKSSFLSPTQRLQANARKLKTLNTHIGLKKDITRLKGQVLAILEKADPSRTLRGARGTEFLGIYGAHDILLQTKRAQELASKMKKLPTKYQRLSKTMEEKLTRLAETQKIISNYTSEGKVWAGFDWWAKKVVTPYARYFLPQKFYRSQNPKTKRAADLIKRRLRSDYIYINKRYEPIPIKGENVKLAWETGSFDVVGDVIAQYRARQHSPDPRERIWGDSPYHIDITPGEKYAGIHFDLVASFIHQVMGWSLGMPLSYARMGKSYGSAQVITYGARIKDGIMKSYQPPNLIWGFLQSYPVWGVAGFSAKMSFKKRGDDYDPQVYEEMQKEINKRLFSFRSVVERKLYGSAIGLSYVSPQYYMQTELNKVLGKIVPHGKLIEKLIAKLVMPFSTGYKIHQWWPDYFGATNPHLIELLKIFQAEGVLDKIDEKGHTVLGRWTLHEIETVSTLITLLEMQKLEKEIPLPQDDPVALADWYATLYERLNRNNESEKIDLERLLSQKLKVASGKGDDTPYVYEEEVQELLAHIRGLKDQMIVLVNSSHEKERFILREKEIDPQKETLGLMTSLLDDAAMVQAQLTKALGAMGSNKKSFRRHNLGSNSIAILDSVILFDLFFSNRLLNVLRSPENKAKGPAQKAIRKAQRRYKNVLARIGARSIFAAGAVGLPLYFWFDHQRKAHALMEKNNADLLEELQDILFTLTYELSAAQVHAAYGGSVWPTEMVGGLKEYAKILEAKKSLLEEILTKTYSRNEKLATEHVYRIPRIFTEYAPIGMGMGLSWMGVRHFLWKSTKGFVTRRVDKYAPGLVKYSILLWFTLGHVAQGLEEEIALTSYDLFKLSSAYQQTLMEQAIVGDVLVNRNIDPEKDYAEFVKSDELLNKVLLYREGLTKVLEHDQDH
ncbi:MAG: hypothetical protein OXB88_00185 [Bacteriovoracales bacterium]|nr:hypothetical protein [Bacteriovoracales bacterium]